MKKYIIATFLVLGTIYHSQTKNTAKENKVLQEIILCENPDQLPIFPGGMNAFRREISNTLRTQDVKASGQISSDVSFIVDKTGNIIEVKGSGNPSLSRELVRTVRKIKVRWQPALKDGEAVAYLLRVPIHMSIETTFQSSF